jgi:hypothetical protein
MCFKSELLTDRVGMGGMGITAHAVYSHVKKVACDDTLEVTPLSPSQSPMDHMIMFTYIKVLMN